MSEGVRVLHVIDDPKFVPYCKLTFEIDYVTNEYCSSDAFALMNNFQGFDFILLHYLDARKATVINTISFQGSVIWFMWGNDGFRLGKFFNVFLLNKTRRLRSRLAFKYGIKHGIKSLVYNFFPALIDRNPSLKQITRSFNRIDVVVPIVPSDYYLLNEKYPISARMFHLNYVNPIFSRSESTIVGGNILLGNSASLTNNHLEAIDLLAEVDLKGRNVILPLSYGDAAYGEIIADYARSRLGDNAICLTKFLDYDEYQKLISSCSIVIMNHLRQQALGNIVQSLMNGASLYLNKSSSLYAFLCEVGIEVFDITSLPLQRELTPEQIVHNKEICLDTFGTKRQRAKVQLLFGLPSVD